MTTYLKKLQNSSCSQHRQCVPLEVFFAVINMANNYLVAGDELGS